EQEGTYPLPEAQTDRFLLKIKTEYPSPAEELEIVNRYAVEQKPIKLNSVLNKNSLLFLQKIVRQVPISSDIKKYAVGMVTSTRNKKNLIEYGASPRASIGLVLASKARALIEGRKYVSKQDINAMAYPVLRHRLILSFEAERQNMDVDDVIKTLIK
ncbi:MoxR family ATPase, partial [Candidatus Woesearchaeota archaeon]|nr:MoxR family ATPase [Candidatus Woesearchaeota archaeon]